MSISLELLLVIMFILTVSIISIVLLTLYNKWSNQQNKELEAKVLNFICSNLNNLEISKKTIKQNQLLKNKKIFFKKYIDYCQISQNNMIIEKANQYFKLKKLDKKYIKQLNSVFNFKRKQAAMFLGYINLQNVVPALEKRLQIETENLVKLYICEALTKQNQISSVKVIIESLFYANKWYKDKIFVLLSNFDFNLYTLLLENIESPRPEIHELIIYFSENYPATKFKNYLLTEAKRDFPKFQGIENIKIPENFSFKQEFIFHNKSLKNDLFLKLKKVYSNENITEFLRDFYYTIKKEIDNNKNYNFEKNAFKYYTKNSSFFNNLFWKFKQIKFSENQKNIVKDIEKFVFRKYLLINFNNKDKELKHLIIKALAKNYFAELNDDYFLLNQDFDIRNIAIQAISKQLNAENIEKISYHLNQIETRKTTIAAINNILSHKTELTDIIIHKFDNEQNNDLKLAYAEILLNKIDYFLHSISQEKDRNIDIIKILIINGLTSKIIAFLNSNKDKKIELQIIGILNSILLPDFKFPLFSISKSIDFLTTNIDIETDNFILNEINEKLDLQLQNKDEIIEYLTNINDDKTIEIHSIIGKKSFEISLRTYLKEDILQKLKLQRYKPVRPKREEIVEKDKIKILKWIHISLYLVFPFFYSIWHYETIKITPIIEQIFFYLIILVFPIMYSFQHFTKLRKFKNWEFIALLGILFIIPILNYLVSKDWIHLTSFFAQARFYIIDFNYYLIFYSISINFIYIILLILSFFGLKQQVQNAGIKKDTFLYKDKILPSISIIAPAYAEEENIIESVNSQLNLEYPKYELIVVSDGSPDNTLKVLIDYFELERVDVFIEEKVSTQLIRGIYKNEKFYPKLTVVDKVNGGKADALNVGINVAKNDYFCGIDSDSLLEPNALIKLAAMSLNSEKESVAFGGNIFPINSSVVHKGKLESISIPKEQLAAFQTIEYIRAFMSGRVGWAYINSLLIISGAFGLFKKDRVIEMGGYLTGKSRFHKDTVGEDMELVVRLSRYMLENKLPYSIHYCYNANCWTEVPELLKISQIKKKIWKERTAEFIANKLQKFKILNELKAVTLRDKIINFLHINERMQILVNQRDITL